MDIYFLTLLSVLIAGLVVLLYELYRLALPKPLPGIPYNKSAANSIMGDLPDILAHVSSTDQIFPWLTAQNVKLNSPIVQVFGRPFGRPWVVVTDFKETQDILLRRTKEFDRSEFLGDVFVGIVPEGHIHMKTADPRFKSNRYLMNPVMTSGFLYDVAAPSIYANMEKLIDLWSLKAKLAQGHPFSAASDVFNGTLDFIVAASLGLDTDKGTTYAQVQLLSSLSDLELPKNKDKPVEFPSVQRDPELEAVITITDSMEAAVKSPVPRWHHTVLRQFPYLRQANTLKEKMITRQLKTCLRRFNSGDQTKRCVLDDVLQREMKAAEKEQREPVYNSRAIYDELFTLLIGGHDTVSTTVAWVLKFMSDNQLVQSTLRSHLQNEYNQAYAAGRNPSVSEITQIQIPYLEAVIEESLRTAITFPGVIRDAITDTSIFGYPIPAGTTVFLLHNGPDYFSDGFDIPNSKRSETSQASKMNVGTWDASDREQFKPERWLVKGENDKEVFNPLAGPHLAFGLGERACYGKKLAILELKVILVLLIWNFEFGMCAPELSSYDAVDKNSRNAKMCYVCLTEVER